MLDEVWLLAVPHLKDRECPESVVKRLRKHHGEENMLLLDAMPEQLMIGTLDTMLEICDRVKKLITTSGIALKRLGRQMVDLLLQYDGKTREDDVMVKKIIDHIKVFDLSPREYLMRFSWMDTVYPPSHPPDVVIQQFDDECRSINNLLTMHIQKYSILQQRLMDLKRKMTGSLLNRDLSDVVVKNRDKIYNSEYIVTLLIVVNRNDADEFYKKYSTIHDHVVSGSAMLVTEDRDSLLFSVACMKVSSKWYAVELRKHRFIPREYEVKETTEDVMIESMSQEHHKAQKKLIQWCRIQFSYLFQAWVHLKFYILFVETKLRFISYPYSVIMIIPPSSSSSRHRLRKCLSREFSYLSKQYREDDRKGRDGIVSAHVDEDSMFYPLAYQRIQFDLFT